MSPAIVVDSRGDVRLGIGAAGGSKITTSIAYVRGNTVFFYKDEEISAYLVHMVNKSPG